jgi:hypothetical protein
MLLYIYQAMDPCLQWLPINLLTSHFLNLFKKKFIVAFNVNSFPHTLIKHVGKYNFHWLMPKNYLSSLQHRYLLFYECSYYNG